MKKLLISFLFFTTTLFSNPLEKELDLQQCLYIALENNPLLKQKLYFEISKKNSLEQIYSDLYPKINTQYGYNKQLQQNKNETPITNKSYNAKIEILQNLLNATSYKKIDIAKKEHFISKLESQKQKEDVIFNVIRSYINILIYLESIKVAEVNLNYYKQYIEMIQNFVNAGVRTQNDLLKANSELKNAEVELIKINNLLEISKLELLFFMGLLNKNQPLESLNFSIKRIDPEDFSISLIKKKEILNSVTSKFDQYPEIFDIALKHRKDYLIQKKEIELSKLGLALQKTGHYPTLGASFTYSLIDDQYSLNSPERKSFDLSIFVRIPLFEGFSTKNKIEEYESLYYLQLEKETYLKQSINLEIQSNLKIYKEIEQKLFFYKESYEYAKQNLNLTQKRYQNGLGTFLELTDATNLYYISTKNLMQTKYELELKKIEILKSLGMLMEIL